MVTHEIPQPPLYQSMEEQEKAPAIKTSKLKGQIMRKNILLVILLLTIFQSCVNTEKPIVVWTVGDIVALWGLGIVISIWVIFFIVMYIKELIKKRKR